MLLKRIAVGLVAIAALLGLGAGTSWATSGHSKPAPVRCNTAWTQNPDETTRKPVQKPGGMLFTGSDLIHHATSLDVKDLRPGSYHAFPQPDQPSFFSVEVGDVGTYAGYATLRWDLTTYKWTMVTGGQLYSNVSAAALVDMPTTHKSHHVFSFGVGYTEHPPGTVATLVTSVTFQHQTYWLGCKPPYHRPTPRPCVTRTVTPLHSVGNDRRHWCKPTYTHSPTPTPTPSTPVPTPTESAPPGEAPAPTPVNTDLPVTG